MAVTSNRKITIQFSSDVTYSQEFSAAASATSPGQVQTVSLASGLNTITPPVGAKAVTIIPPAGNVVTITLKGVTGDTGVPLALIDPTSLGLASAAAFVLTTSGIIVGLRLIYS